MEAVEWLVVGSLLLIVLLCILAAVFWQDKGQAGETSVYRILEKLDGRKALLPNCCLPMPDGTATEVDLILLHESGVYVIESKNCSGWIFGSENQEKWTQSQRSKYGVQKTRFYNPIWQNRAHIRALMRLLKGKTVPFYSYIAFGDGCELKDIRLTSGMHHVTQYRSLLKEISRNAQRMGRCLSDETMDEIYELLVQYAGAAEEQKAQHTGELHAKQYPLIQLDGTWVCPQCGGQLVLRTAKTGPDAGRPFWGCSNYPECRFIYQE